MLLVLGLLIQLSRLAAENAFPAVPDWKEMVIVPSEKLMLPSTQKAVGANTGLSTSIESKNVNPKTSIDLPYELNAIEIPGYTMAIVSGFIVPQPVSKFKMDFSAGMSVTWYKGLNIEFMGVIPGQLHFSAAWLFRFRDDRYVTANTAFYAGLSVLARAGDIFPSLVDPRKYAPTFGLRFYHRKDREYTGLLLDNRYEFALDDGGALRILFLIGYYFPL